MKSDTVATQDTHAPQTAPVGTLTRRQRLLALVLVLSISVLHFVLSSSYVVFGGTYSSGSANQNQYRVANALLLELTSLLLLWYVLWQQKRSWKEIGWEPSWHDPFRAIGIIVTTYVVTYPTIFFFQLIYRDVTGHYLHSLSRHGVLGLGISVFSILFVVVNPFFEELIVRAYTMSEVIGLASSRTLAIVVSVCIQMSYHLYQGLLNCVVVAISIVILSIYFAKTRRIMPVILTHLFFDAYAFVRLNA
jgi:membrane protease YdiL (CAAX protease family)